MGLNKAYAAFVTKLIIQEYKGLLDSVFLRDWEREWEQNKKKTKKKKIKIKNKTKKKQTNREWTDRFLPAIS